MSSVDLSAAVAAYLVEGRELAQELEQGLLKLDGGHDRQDGELINALFRAAHTIKGSAGIVGIDSIGPFMHSVETLLSRVRDGEPLLDDAMLTRLLRCCDHLNLLLDRAQAGDFTAEALHAPGLLLLEGLNIAGGAGAAAAHGAPAASRTPPHAEGDTLAACGLRLWMAFGQDCMANGLDPASALLYLHEHTPLQDVQLLTECVPPLEQIHPEECHLALGARIPAGDTARIQEAFEFFLEGSLIVTVRDSESPQAVHEALKPLRERLSDEAMMAWRETGLISDEEWNGVAPAAAASQLSSTTAVVSAAPAPAPAAAPAAAGGSAAQAPARFVRVPADRLDELMVQVGELVIASAGIDVLARENGETRLQEAASSLLQLVDVIQSGTLKLRMVPIGETFSRFQRVVRDVSRDLGKRINLEVTGADTEMDKSMVERIGDPLMHLVRNAMDHGLETPEERLAAGKDEVGTVCLQAYHDSGNVIIEVSDDGRGLNRDRILNKAIERGLVANGDGLSDNDVFQLIFQPGFSTAEQVTSLSGRGVGMDVVKRTIEALRGTITLRSWEGFGSQVQMRLPLTLAIIDGFMVGVGQARFILPLDQVLECIELPKGALEQGQPDYIDLRGEVLPYTSLRQFFGLEAQAEGLRRPSVVVVRSGGHKTGILVDTLHGEIQTVIKPMTGIFRHLRGISGTAILGSGDIALILDVMQLVEHGIERARNSSSVPMGTSL